MSGVRDSSGSPDLAGRRRALNDGHALARPPAGCGVKWVADRRVPVKVPATLAGECVVGALFVDIVSSRTGETRSAGCAFRGRLEHDGSCSTEGKF